MNEVDNEDLVIQSIRISTALKGLETVLYHFPPISEAKVSDIDEINGMVAAITALAEKNAQDVSGYFE